MNLESKNKLLLFFSIDYPTQETIALICFILIMIFDIVTLLLCSIQFWNYLPDPWFFSILLDWKFLSLFLIHPQMLYIFIVFSLCSFFSSHLIYHSLKEFSLFYCSLCLFCHYCLKTSINLICVGDIDCGTGYCI